MDKLLRATRVQGWYEYYRTPCIICGHTGGCMISEDGSAVACIRVPSEKYFSKNSALPSYLHLVKGDKKRKIDKNEIENFQAGHEKQDDKTLNAVYRTFLDCLSISDEHYEHLTSNARKLTDSQISIRNYRSFPDKPWEVARKIQEELNINHFRGIPGFYLSNDSYWSIVGAKGILMPFRNHYNKIVGFQYRIDNPPNVVEVKLNRQGMKARIKEQPNLVQVTYDGEIIFESEIKIGKKWTTIYHENDVIGWIRVKKGNRYFWLSSANKPEGTGSGNPVPIHIAVPSRKLAKWKEGTLHKCQTVWLSEGPLKCDIAADYIEKLYDPQEIDDIGDTFIATPGVGAWRLALPIMKEMGVSKVNICFDADSVSNPQVKAHLMACAKELKAEGFSANLVLWNEEDKGIDDLFLNNKLPHIKTLF